MSTVISAELRVSTLKHIAPSPHMLQIWCNVPWAPTSLLLQRQPDHRVFWRFLLISQDISRRVPGKHTSKEVRATSYQIFTHHYVLFWINSAVETESLNAVGMCQWVLPCCCCCSVDGLGLLVSFRINLKLWILQTGDRTPWTGDQPVAMNVPTQDNMNRKKMHTSMPRVGFNPTIPVFERAKTFHALDPRPLWSAWSSHFMYYLLVRLQWILQLIIQMWFF
jgi:hypothetical protein